LEAAFRWENLPATKEKENGDESPYFKGPSWTGNGSYERWRSSSRGGSSGRLLLLIALALRLTPPFRIAPRFPPGFCPGATHGD
jgi:hypothetical protein